MKLDLNLRGRLPGVAVASSLALAAGWIAGGLGDPLARNPVLVAMLFGLVLGNVFDYPAVLQPGLDFTKRYLLRLGVILLGFRITVALLGDLGIVPIAIAAFELVAVLCLLRWFAIRWLKVDPQLALLVAVGSSVCGAAAILSVASMLKDREQHAGVAIALITMAGTIALLLYPVAFLDGHLPGIDESGFGIMVGASIFELAQVYGASFAVSEGALNIATLVKLSKVVMLIPLLIVFGIAQRRKSSERTGRHVAVPWFVFAFLAVLLFNSAVTVQPQVRSAILQAGQFLFLMVMIALGLTTSLRKLLGGDAIKLVGMGIFALVLSASMAYGLVWAMQRSAAGSKTPVVTASTSAGARAAESEQTVTAVGARLFTSVGCAKCHVPSLRGVHGDVLLYSDLLLHDMGASLDDKITQGNATGADWRTTPLVGLRERVRFLHDGRAGTLRDAVLEHAGEAEIVRKRFFELDEDEQQEIYRFMSAL
ncbi:MAG: putative sulfate exporter family transporter [Rhodoferax sp.]|uniref:putative sulfate exporter family transporter n=1 Tax=Rhodoferax sp. TaxID=50421 RepID=UPI0032630460